MTIRNILAPMPYVKSGTRALETALDVAKIFDAHVTAFHVSLDPNAPIPYVAGPMPTELLVQISENAEEHARKLTAEVKAACERICKERGVNLVDDSAERKKGEPCTTWRDNTGSADYRYGLEGRLYDLSVVLQPDADDRETTTDVLEGLLFHSARPVLMAPASGTIKLDGKIVLAWNGSVEATRALRGALPFLTRASQVVLLSVGDEDDLEGPDAHALAESLSWYGVSADIVETAADGKSDGEAVLDAVTDLKADFLVMGAYSHSRLRELIWGGVTQEVIEGAKVPVLMTH